MSFIFTFLTLSPICYFSLLSHTNTHTQLDSVFFLSRYHDADHDDNNNNDDSSKVQLSLTSNVTTTEQTQKKKSRTLYNNQASRPECWTRLLLILAKTMHYSCSNSIPISNYLEKRRIIPEPFSSGKQYSKKKN